MNNLKIFNFKGNNIRTVEVNEVPYFVGKDVADVLGYSETNAMTKRLDDDEFISAKLSGMNMNSTLINESGLYSAILGSKLPTAKLFKHWVTHEVIPSIRKNGVYMTDKKAYDITHNPDSLADLLLQAGEQLKRKDIQISELTPKAQFADQISKSTDTILVRDLAKLLYKNGIAIGQKELFRWLVEKDYLIRKSNGYTPTQRAVALKVMEVRETPILHQYTQPTISFTTLVTTKGQQYFINKFLSANRKVEA
ncbi:phage antirepressor [Companilactobacillus muriivasis]|uniref:phage antirepressor n=1 Tax=Companilactobacillus muriivasis TaxID=3081444 RepID=UPI0030C7471B